MEPERGPTELKFTLEGLLFRRRKLTVKGSNHPHERRQLVGSVYNDRGEGLAGCRTGSRVVMPCELSGWLDQGRNLKILSCRLEPSP